MRRARPSYPTPPLFFRRSPPENSVNEWTRPLFIGCGEGPLNDMSAGAVVRIGAPTVFLQRITTTNISNLWMREEQLIKELRDNRHLNIIVSRTRICSKIYTYKFSKLYIRQKQTLCTFSCSASFDIEISKMSFPGAR